LNKGIDLAKGELLARMDADDIALPERLQKQIAFLQTTKVDLVASTVKLIDFDGNTLPYWEADMTNIDSNSIRTFLLKDNCIAHPTVVGKTVLFRKYRYQLNQKYSEDYDLWLRMIADGLTIGKISEPLLLHRILHTSATRFKKVNTYYRLTKVKFRFLWQRLKNGRINVYTAQVFAHAIIDLMKAGGKEVKGLLAK
jgi:glycosyltransferase involved in cell wall biosynthesis